MAQMKLEQVVEDMEMDDGNSKPSSSNLCKYCKEECNPYSRPSLKCEMCRKKIHITCLKNRTVPGSLLGDVFFDLNCKECHPLKIETVTRQKMNWVNILLLTLYNLKEKSLGISYRGYFHWRNNICNFVGENWDILFPPNTKKRSKWTGTISGTLSHCKSTFFQSGNEIEGFEQGFWKLIYSDPPEIQMKQFNKSKKQKKLLNNSKKNNQKSLPVKQSQSSSSEESSLSVGDDSCGEISRTQTPSMFSREYVQPTEFLSDFLLEDDDIPDTDPDIDVLENETIMDLSEQPYSLNDLMHNFQINSGNSEQYSQMLTPEGVNNIQNPAKIKKGIQTELNVEEEEEEEGGEDQEDDDDEEENSEYSKQELPTSLFVPGECRRWPWIKPKLQDLKPTPKMSKSEEEHLLQSIDKTNLDSVPSSVRRLYRKLALRKLKRSFNIPIIDFDSYLNKKSETENDNGNRVIDRFYHDSGVVTFEQRLQGYCEPISVHSPYTNRLLKPFIRRDSSSRPLWMRVMQELCKKVNKNNPNWVEKPLATIDYCYIRPQHIPAINSLCNQFFWPGIDMTECLQYPDFTCVVVYKKLVVGFAILVPDVGYNEAYITFLFTRPEWRRAGIATFMLYHLIQTCMGKDCTLHVSATNPALILYQKFGFKIEEFVQDFYDKYMPCDTKESRHALFLRLSR